MTFSMAHVYQFPDDTQRTFRMEFRTGTMSDVAEYDDPGDLPETALVCGDPSRTGATCW